MQRRKHGAKSMQRGMLLQSTIALAGAAAENSSYTEYAERAAELGATLISTKYGRDAERESDLYGMNYMTRAGYDPDGRCGLAKNICEYFAEPAKQCSSALICQPPSLQRASCKQSRSCRNVAERRSARNGTLSAGNAAPANHQTRLSSL